jgi:hypothetical protein
MVDMLMEIFDTTLNVLGGEDYKLGVFWLKLIVRACLILSVSESNRRLLATVPIVERLKKVIVMFVDELLPVQNCCAVFIEAAEVAIEVMFKLSYRYETNEDLRSQLMKPEMGLFDILSRTIECSKLDKDVINLAKFLKIRLDPSMDRFHKLYRPSSAEITTLSRTSSRDSVLSRSSSRESYKMTRSPSQEWTLKSIKTRFFGSNNKLMEAPVEGIDNESCADSSKSPERTSKHPEAAVVDAGHVSIDEPFDNIPESTAYESIVAPSISDTAYATSEVIVEASGPDQNVDVHDTESASKVQSTTQSSTLANTPCPEPSISNEAPLELSDKPTVDSHAETVEVVREAITETPSISNEAPLELSDKPTVDSHAETVEVVREAITETPSISNDAPLELSDKPTVDSHAETVEVVREAVALCLEQSSSNEEPQETSAKIIKSRAVPMTFDPPSPSSDLTDTAVLIPSTEEPSKPLREDAITDCNTFDVLATSTAYPTIDYHPVNEVKTELSLPDHPDAGSVHEVTAHIITTGNVHENNESENSCDNKFMEKIATFSNEDGTELDIQNTHGKEFETDPLAYHSLSEIETVPKGLEPHEVPHEVSSVEASALVATPISAAPVSFEPNISKALPLHSHREIMEFPASEATSHIFLSYCRGSCHADYAKSFGTELRQMGNEVWTDEVHLLIA